MVLKTCFMAMLLMAALPLAVRAEPQIARIDVSPYLDQQHLQADRVVVVKSRRKLMLMQGEVVVRSYPIALGRNPVGTKRREGDGRTPEGRYQLDWRNPNSRFYRSLHVSYPSDGDIARARYHGWRPGGMIMIHGQPTDSAGRVSRRKGDWTEGCIAVSNRAIEEIWAAVEDGAPIEIRP